MTLPPFWAAFSIVALLGDTFYIGGYAAVRSSLPGDTASLYSYNHL